MPYKYLGPYEMVNIEGKDVYRGDEFDATDVAYIETLRTRGFHLIEKVGEGGTSAETTSSATPPAEEPAPEAPPA